MCTLILINLTVCVVYIVNMRLIPENILWKKLSSTIVRSMSLKTMDTYRTARATRHILGIFQHINVG